MFVDLPFRGALLLLLAWGLGGSLRLRRAADREGGRLSRSADPAAIAAALRAAGSAYYGALLLWLLWPPSVAWARVPLGSGVRWLGAGLAAAGIALALRALSHLGRNVTPTATARSDGELVTTGPYRRVRHPLYTSMGLTVPGLGLLSANLLVVGAGLATLGVVVARTRREEEELAGRFGRRYADYVERTGRFLPRLR